MLVFLNSLFYLAKSGVHWLKKDAGNQSVLRSNEILLLKVLQARWCVSKLIQTSYIFFKLLFSILDDSFGVHTTLLSLSLRPIKGSEVLIINLVELFMVILFVGLHYSICFNSRSQEYEDQRTSLGQYLKGDSLNTTFTK